MKILYHVPILHNATDLSGKKDGSASAKKFPANQIVIDAFWDEAVRRVLALPVAWKGAVIFQDSMFFRTKLERVVAVGMFADAGSRNMDLIATLIEHGARIVQTEPHRLYKEHDELLRSAADRHSPSFRILNAAYLLLRDADIARRINRVLTNGRAGILFLGSSHCWFRAFLRMDIEVRPLFAPSEMESWMRAALEK